jgi:hypothetical protein
VAAALRQNAGKYSFYLGLLDNRRADRKGRTIILVTRSKRVAQLVATPKDVQMAKIRLDQQLIATARRITTGANIHRIRELIFADEQAVSLHNSGWPTRRAYQQEHEIALQQFITKELRLRFSSSSRSEAGLGAATRRTPNAVARCPERSLKP